jgi:hypothetical protein
VEKVIIALQRADSDEAWCTRMRTDVVADLLELELPGLAVNVRDDKVRNSLMTLTTLDPPVVGFVTVWAHQSYGESVTSALTRLTSEADHVAAYLVTESVPLPPPAAAPGARTDGFANIALLRRPADLDDATWRQRWHINHTPVAIETQSTFGYTQNAVVRALTPAAPAIDAIVEELFPEAAITDLHAFFGADDDAELSRRMDRMVASTSAFGANRDVDTVPTSRYVYRTPFAADNRMG